MMNDTELVLDPIYLLVNDWTKVAATILVSVSFLLGIPGNILVVLVHIKIKQKCATDWMIFYLAMCDVSSLAVLPNYVFMLHGLWPLGFPEALCRLHMTHSNAVSMASYVFCACMALERFVKVVFSKDLFSPRQVQLMWIPTCLFSYGLGMLSYFIVENNANGHCMIDLEHVTLSTISYASVMIVALITSLVIVLCYISIGVYLLRKMKEMSMSGTKENFAKSFQSMLQTTKMLTIVTVVFMLSANIPYIASFITIVHPVTEDPEISIFHILTMLFVFNNFINPFLYFAMSARFRNRALRVLRSCCCCSNPDSSCSESIPNTTSRSC